MSLKGLGLGPALTIGLQAHLQNLNQSLNQCSTNVTNYTWYTTISFHSLLVFS